MCNKFLGPWFILQLELYTSLNSDLFFFPPTPSYTTPDTPINRKTGIQVPSSTPDRKTICRTAQAMLEDLISQNGAGAPDLADSGPEAAGAWGPPLPPPHHQVHSLSSPKSHTQLSGSGRARKRMLPGHRARPRRAAAGQRGQQGAEGHRVPRARGRRLGQPLPEAASTLRAASPRTRP